ncbi:uncharacterized protein LOC121544971 [Coregonus clupeaformis]|uniref:uncharacterized protein LOC121544971 n=1 Tax=Coregonus clupeaformis TaxID=59861 RepID=UPI001E1C4752|nr:uncharacterized protein LOC121544971 [Coregonus clupeaformis]
MTLIGGIQKKDVCYRSSSNSGSSCGSGGGTSCPGSGRIDYCWGCCWSNCRGRRNRKWYNCCSSSSNSGSSCDSGNGTSCLRSDRIHCWWDCCWIICSKHDVCSGRGKWRWGSSRGSCCCSTVSRCCRPFRSGYSGGGEVLERQLVEPWDGWPQEQGSQERQRLLQQLRQQGSLQQLQQLWELLEQQLGEQRDGWPQGLGHLKRRKEKRQEQLQQLLQEVLQGFQEWLQRLWEVLEQQLVGWLFSRIRTSKKEGGE